MFAKLIIGLLLCCPLQRLCCSADPGLFKELKRIRKKYFTSSLSQASWKLKSHWCNKLLIYQKQKDIGRIANSQEMFQLLFSKVVFPKAVSAFFVRKIFPRKVIRFNPSGRSAVVCDSGQKFRSNRSLTLSQKLFPKMEQFLGGTNFSVNGNENIGWGATRSLSLSGMMIYCKRLESQGFFI